MLLTSLALALSLQSSGETFTAVTNDDPETWVVEYPRVIRPFVVQYRQCLNLSDRWVRGRADFEEQHRTDIPRCAEERETAIKGATAEMAGAKTKLNQDELTKLFRNIGQIHIARGRDLDDQFRNRIAASESAIKEFDENRPKGLVMELVDGSVVKSRAEVEATADGTGQSKAVN